MMAIKSAADVAIDGLKDDGYKYRADHRHLAAHWVRYEVDRVRIAQVGPLNIAHCTLSKDAYENGSRAEFEAIGVEVLTPAN